MYVHICIHFNYCRLSYTIEDIMNEILSLSVNFKPNVGQRSEKSFELIQADGDLLKKSLMLQNQYEIICQCLIELIAIPFPHSKSIRPALILNIIKRVFDTSLSDYSKLEGNEAKILFFVMPKIYCASMNLGKILMVTSKTSWGVF